jgi:hypothetical protein
MSTEELSTGTQDTVNLGILDENGLHPDRSTPLALASFGNWLRLASEFGVEPKFWRRAMFISLASPVTGPLRWYDRIRYGHASKTPLSQPPLFIIGHPRSGTTHLHYLLARDDQWGYINSYQVMAAGFSLVARDRIKPVLSRFIPPTRMTDNMRLDADTPQEAENALANLTPYSFYHYFMFPTRVQEHLRRTMLDGIPARELARWKETYIKILRRATFLAGGRRLLDKNPVHIGRIGTVLEMFPDAKFIHIYRDPYVVFLSNVKLHRTLTCYFRLRELDGRALEENILLLYEGLMQRYLEERHLIPQGNLVDVRYEELDADPLAELGRIYGELDLPGFAEAEGAFRDYVESIADYQKNVYTLTDDARRKVNHRWGFAFDALGYEMLRAS